MLRQSQQRPNYFNDPATLREAYNYYASPRMQSSEVSSYRSHNVYDILPSSPYNNYSIPTCQGTSCSMSRSECSSRGRTTPF